MSSIKHVDRYYAGIGKIEAAEARFKAAIDALFAAKQAKRAAEITALRLASQKAEQELVAIMQEAANAHRDYWQDRRAAMLPQLRQAAELMQRFNRICMAAGDQTNNPARAILDNELLNPVGVDIVEEVPAEGPDSQVLNDFRGIWK